MSGLHFGLSLAVSSRSRMAAPGNTVLPAISGTPTVGETLSCSTGTWTNEPDSYAYQWLADDVEIDGATAATYELTSGEIGEVITCTVTATNAGGSADATSAGTDPVADADPNFANVVFLCSFDGADGATTATDDSNSAHALTFVGNAQIDTGQSKFGGSSVLFDGTGDYITMPDSTDWDLADANSDPYTIECWTRINNLSAARALFGQTSGFPQAATRCFITSGGEITFEFSASGGAWTSLTTSGAAIMTGTWYHVAIDKDAAGKVRIYVDGVMRGSSTPANSAIFNSIVLMNIGAYGGGSSPMNGWIDEMRITKGVARYASDGGFSVPTGPFPRP